MKLFSLIHLQEGFTFYPTLENDIVDAFYRPGVGNIGLINTQRARHQSYCSIYSRDPPSRHNQGGKTRLFLLHLET